MVYCKGVGVRARFTYPFYSPSTPPHSIHSSISHPHKIPSIHQPTSTSTPSSPSTSQCYSIPPSPQNSIHPYPHSLFYHKATFASSIHLFYLGESLYIYSFSAFFSFRWWMSDRWWTECGRQMGTLWQSEDYLISFCHGIWWIAEGQMVDEWWMTDRVQ